MAEMLQFISTFPEMFNVLVNLQSQVLEEVKVKKEMVFCILFKLESPRRQQEEEYYPGICGQASPQYSF